MALRAGEGRRHLVLATEATVAQHAYAAAIAALDPQAEVEELACSLFVALAEEGWTEGAVAVAAAEAYLRPIVARPTTLRPATIILGCTHFPLLTRVIRTVIGSAGTIVDSATATAKAVDKALRAQRLTTTSPARGALKLLVTDGASRFAKLGPRFLGELFGSADVELVDL